MAKLSSSPKSDLYRHSRRLVAALSGTRLEPLRYRMSAETRKRVTATMREIPGIAGNQILIEHLEELIGRYQIFRRQDRETLHSERVAITQLTRAERKARELILAYEKAMNYFPARTRVSVAWSTLQARRPTHIRDVPIKYSETPEFFSDRETHVLEFAKVLSIAAKIPLGRDPRGGRPSVSRARHFVQEFHGLVQDSSTAPLPTLRRGPLKQLLELSLREVGWQFADVRPLLAKLEKPASRKKPTL